MHLRASVGILVCMSLCILLVQLEQGMVPVRISLFQAPRPQAIPLTGFRWIPENSSRRRVCEFQGPEEAPLARGVETRRPFSAAQESISMMRRFSRTISPDEMDEHLRTPTPAGWARSKAAFAALLQAAKCCIFTAERERETKSARESKRKIKRKNKRKRKITIELILKFPP